MKSRYELDIPEDALILPSYSETPEQVGRLRAALRSVTQESGGVRHSLSAVLREAGLNRDDGTGLRYEPSALKRFIDGSTEKPNLAVARALFARWAGNGSRRLNLSAVENVFYHGALVAMEINEHNQSELGRLLSGYYLFYKRSAINPDFFIRGLLFIYCMHSVVHVTEIQYHFGGDGVPQTEEVDEGFAVMKGNIIYFLTRSRALKGATFTVIHNHPVRPIPDKKDEEEISVLFGYQIGGREFTPPTSSPFAAERISEAVAKRVRRSRARSDSAVNSEASLGFCGHHELPKLLQRHLKGTS